MGKTKRVGKTSVLNRWLDGIERVGNRLFHPITIFALFALGVIILSAVCELAGVSACGELVNSSKGIVEEQTVNAVSLLNGKGIVYMITHACPIFCKLTDRHAETAPVRNHE